MKRSDAITHTMRTVRFHHYGEPGDVLRLESAAVPNPGPGVSCSSPKPQSHERHSL